MTTPFRIGCRGLPRSSRSTPPRAILNLVWSGTAERYPNVRLIFSHAGGTAPFLAWRWSLLDFLPGTRERAPRGVVHYLKGFFYDTALSANPHALRSLCELVPRHRSCSERTSPSRRSR